MKLQVGLTTLVGHISTYAERFDLLEMRCDPSRSPSSKALRRLRATAPEELTFSVLVPPTVSSLALEKPEAVAQVLEMAEILRARWIVIQTGAEVGPSPRARTRLAALAQKLASAERRVAWEPRGPWEPEVAAEMARTSGLVFVEDLSMVDAQPADVFYTRLRVPGPGAALRGGAIERLAEQLVGSKEAIVVIEGRGSARARSLISRSVAAASEMADEGDDDMLEEDDAVLGSSGDDDEEEDENDEAAFDDDFDDEDDEVVPAGEGVSDGEDEDDDGVDGPGDDDEDGPGDDEDGPGDDEDDEDDEDFDEDDGEEEEEEPRGKR